MTAHLCTFVDGLPERATVLVTGAAGAVGHCAVRLDKCRGMTVIGTVSSGAKAAIAREAGDDVVINDRTEDVAARVAALTSGRGVDQVVEVDFRGNIAASAVVLKTNGTLAYDASRGNDAPPFPAYAFMRKNVSIHATLLATKPEAQRRRAQDDITTWLHEGPRLHRIAGVLALADIVRAHELVESGETQGTVVVTCAEP